jgi:diguanylate cyclase (GGDEF)-like protein
MTEHILIVDDDSAIREAMHEFMSMAKLKSTTVASAEEALKFLDNNRVDVVITDIQMAGMDGLELTDIINQDYHADVIVITGFSADYSYEEAISKGASDFIFKPIRFEELLLRVKRVLKERKLTIERSQMLEKLKKLAITDGLTKLYNSRYFYSQLETEIDRLTRYNHLLSILLLDIDNFKQYNDTYGHIEGDKVLARLGMVIMDCLRTMDTGYRYGGEEFTILLPETGIADACTVAKRIQNSLKKEIFNPEQDINITITVSIGITEYCSNEDMPTFIQRADKAMYLSKKKGKDTISALPPEK